MSLDEFVEVSRLSSNRKHISSCADTAHQDYRSTAPIDVRSEALEMEDLPHATDLQHCPPPERRDSPVVTGTRGQNRALLRMILALDRDTRETLLEVLHEFKTSLDRVGRIGVNQDAGSLDDRIIYDRIIQKHHRQLFDCPRCIRRLSNNVTSNVIVCRACSCTVELRQTHRICAEEWLRDEKRCRTCSVCGEKRLVAILRPLQKNHVVKPVLPPLQKENHVQPGTRFALLLRKPFKVFYRHVSKVKDVCKRCLNRPKC